MKKRKAIKNIEDNFIFSYAGSFIKNFAEVSLDNYKMIINGKGQIKKKSNKSSYSNEHTFFQHNSLWGCISKDCIIIPPVYIILGGVFKNRYLQAKLKEKWGLIDTSNNIIIPFIYDFVDVRIIDECDLEIFIVEREGKYGVIDIYENILIPLEYDDIDFDSRKCKFQDIIFIAKRNNNYGLINIQNKIITSFKYKSIKRFGKKHYIAREKNNQVIIIDKLGNQICKQTFQNIISDCFENNYSTKLYPAQINNLYGYIDELGEIKIECNYLKAFPFKHGYARIEREFSKTFELINKKGKTVILDNYDIVDTYDENGDFIINNMYLDYDILSKNRIMVSRRGKWGIINKKNIQITDFIFDEIHCYNDYKKDYFPARIGKKYGFIDKNGKPLEIKYDN